MTLKTKKISLGALAAISIVAVPVATVVSCGSETKGEKEKISWVDQVLRTKHTKEMVFSNINAKDRNVNFIEDMFGSIIINFGGKEFDYLKTEMDRESKFDFPVFASGYWGPTLSHEDLESASDTFLEEMFNTQKKFMIKAITEMLTLKTIVFNFSDKTTFKLTLTKEEQNIIRKYWIEELENFRNILNVDHYKIQRDLIQYEKKGDTQKVEKIKKIYKKTLENTNKKRGIQQNIWRELKTILRKRITNILNKK